MNKTFRVIFNHTTGQWVAVSELARVNGKKHTHNNNNCTVSGSLKKAFAPLCLALMGVLGSTNLFASQAYCYIDDTSKAFYCTGGVATGNSSVSLGDQSKALGKYSISMGYYNTAEGENSVSIGRASHAYGKDSSTLGYGNTASGNYSSAVGYSNTASGDNSSALGRSNTASGQRSSAVGSENTASGNYSSAVGYYNTASGNSSSALGIGNTASGSESSALGHENTASGNSSSAVGYFNYALSTYSQAFGGYNNYSGSGISSVTMGTGAVAVGYRNNYKQTGAVTVGQESTAVGVSNTASGNYSSAVGYLNTASGYGSSAVGSENTASGEDSSAVGSENIASGNYSSAVGYYNTASGEDSSALGHGNTASGNASSAVGYSNYALSAYSQAFGGYNNYSGDGISSVTMGTGAVALGYQNNYKASGTVTVGKESTAVGVKNTASGDYSSALGRSNTASGQNSSSLGEWNTASGQYSSALGRSNTASGVGSSAVGIGNTANKLYSSAFGVLNTAEVDFGTAVGFGSLANRDQGTKGVYAPANLDSLDAKGKAAWQATSAALAVGNPDNTNLKYYDPNTDSYVEITTPITRQITGVAAGSEDTDAVNVAQLKEVAALASGGSFSPFTVSDGGSGSFTVGSAGNLKMVGSNANITTTASGDTVTFALADNLNLTSVTTGGVKLSADGLNNGGKVISNVAAGSKDTDAVNVKQLNDAVANAGKTTLGAVKGDNKNITTKATDKEVQVALNDDITLNSVTTGGVKLSATGLNNGGNVISNVAAGSKDTDAVNVKQLKDANAANLKASVNAVKGDNKNITTKAGDKEVQVALNNDISLNSVTAADKITVGSLTVNQNGKITGVVSDINDDSTAVNVGLLKEELKKGGNYRPIMVAGDTGSFEVDNGGKAIWAGDSKNITTAANGDTVKIELNKNIEVDSVTAGSTVVNNDGVKVGNNGVALTQNGLNNGGQVISGVGAGVRPTDAVNVSQLNNAMGSVYGRIDSVEKHANAGIAQAMATGAMMTSTQAGQGFLSLSGSTYRGEQGYAMGYSHMSDSGKWGVKFIGSGNSRGKFGGAASVGFRLY